jgi:hypothetical protein
MRTDKKGDARGRLSWGWSFLGDPGGEFGMENGAQAQNQKKLRQYEEASERSFCSCFSSLGEPVLSGPQQSRARRFVARGSEPLTARTAGKQSAREERTSFTSHVELAARREVRRR